ncbi:hypothetical protein GOP47_0029462 [Adiantum capillus-veneris]|nr:hypothetical protein GOP47_0029462 [Adiantum capillus-veneris]
MASSLINQAWCGHGVNCSFFFAWKPPLSKSTMSMLAASTSIPCTVDSQLSSSASVPKRFSHLSPLLSQLLSASSAEVPVILDPWLPLLTAEDWNVLIADVGSRSWSSSVRVFYTFKQKSPLWHRLLHESESAGDNAPVLSKLCTTLVRLLAKKQRKEEIAALQKQMQENNIPRDTAFYNALFTLYADHGQVDEISKGLLDMEAAGIRPDQLTHELLITGYLCGEALDLYKAESLLQNMTKEGMPVSANIFRKLINGFWEANNAEGAERVFVSMQDAGYLPDSKVINKLMQLHGRKGNYERNLELFNLLRILGIQQIQTAYGFLLHSYCKAGLLKQAQESFKNIQKITGSKPTLVNFNMIMNACGKHGLHEEVLNYYGILCNSGLEANVVSYCTVISAMVTVGKFEKAEQLYKRMLIKGIQPNLHIYLTMIHCYMKCKKTRLGRELYFAMRKARIKMTETAYSTVLALYVEGRWYEHAATTFKRLEREGFNLDTAAHGVLIRAFGDVNEDMAPLVQAIESSKFDLCKLLNSLSLITRQGPRMSSSLQKFLGDYFDRVEAGNENANTRAIYNAFFDCFWQRGLKRTAQILLEKARKGCAASTCPTENGTEWILDVRGLSVGGTKVAVAEWLNRVDELRSDGLVDKKKMIIITGVGDFPHMVDNKEVVSQKKGLKGALLYLLLGLRSPFVEMPENPTALEASAVDVVKWLLGGALKKEMSLVDCL